MPSATPGNGPGRVLGRGPYGHRRGRPAGDYVGDVAVEAGPRTVVAHGGTRVGVGRGFLHIAERNSGVAGFGAAGYATRRDLTAIARASFWVGRTP